MAADHAEGFQQVDFLVIVHQRGGMRGVRDGKIKLHFNSEGYVIHKDSVSQDRGFMWSIGVVLAQGYVDSLRDNVKRSIAQKLRNGEWISQAPIGYTHFTNQKGQAGHHD